MSEPDPTAKLGDKAATKAAANAAEGARAASEFVFLYTTLPDLDAVREISRALLADRLAACVNCSAAGTSFFEWEGEVQEEPELYALIKTRRACVDAAMARIAGLHPYDEPAILILPVEGGAASFLDWVRAQTGAS